jgi:hypothetical protein
VESDQWAGFLPPRLARVIGVCLALAAVLVIAPAVVRLFDDINGFSGQSFGERLGTASLSIGVTAPFLALASVLLLRAAGAHNERPDAMIVAILWVAAVVAITVIAAAGDAVWYVASLRIPSVNSNEGLSTSFFGFGWRQKLEAILPALGSGAVGIATLYAVWHSSPPARRRAEPDAASLEPAHE